MPPLGNSYAAKKTSSLRTILNKIIMINPVSIDVGAAWKTKRWFSENWVELIKILKPKDLFLLILWGNEEEKALAEEVHEKSQAPLSPDFSLKEVMTLVKESSLLISGDTFALQDACAFSRPVVGIFGPTNPGRNGPFSPQDRVAFHEMECSYCYKRSCSSLECLKKIYKLFRIVDCTDLYSEINGNSDVPYDIHQVLLGFTRAGYPYFKTIWELKAAGIHIPESSF